MNSKKITTFLKVSDKVGKTLWLEKKGVNEMLLALIETMCL